MLHCYPYVPVGGEMAVNCAVLSYNGMVYFGFSGDAHAAPDLRKMEKLLEASFTELRDAAGIRPPQTKKIRRKRQAASTAATPATTGAAPVPVMSIAPIDSKRVPEPAPTSERENALSVLTVA